MAVYILEPLPIGDAHVIDVSVVHMEVLQTDEPIETEAVVSYEAKFAPKTVILPDPIPGEFIGPVKVMIGLS